MATQEERLTTLGQGHTAFGNAIKDLQHHVTIVLGVMMKQEVDIKEIKHSLNTLDMRMGR